MAFLCWVMLGNVYPVIGGDMTKLKGQSHFKNYDSHYIPVKPASSSNLNKSVYLACKENDNPTFDEFVVFYHTQIAPHYVFYFTESSNTQTTSNQAKTESTASNWSVEQVCDWLTTLSLSEDYRATFTTNTIDGGALHSFTNEMSPKEMLREIGVVKMGDILKFMKSFKTTWP